MTPDEMRQRTKQYGLRIIQLVQALATDRLAGVLGGQLLRVGTSVGANYRAACRGKSTADFIHKLKIVEEECDESIYWMELIVEAGLMPANRWAELMKEGNEILAIVVASIKRSRSSARS